VKHDRPTEVGGTHATATPSLTVNICRARTSVAEMAEPTGRGGGTARLVGIVEVVGVVLIPLA